MRIHGALVCGVLLLCWAGVGRADDSAESSAIDPAIAATSFDALAAGASDTAASDADPLNLRCPRQSFWFASTEALFLDVNADTGGRITLTLNDSGTQGTDVSFTSGTGLSDYAAAPRLVIGRQLGEKWAVAARYFSLDGSSAEPPRRTPGTTPLPTFGTYLENDTAKLYSIDLEAIRSFTPGQSKLDVTIGARHASLDVDSQLQAFGVITTGNFLNLNLANGCAFDGTGMTTAFLLRRPLGDSRFSLFVGGRGSKLWGHTDSFARVAGAVASAPNAPLVGAATVTRNNAESDLIILEAQLGVQWEMALECVPASVFVRTALEYQHWDINGPPTGGAGFGGTIGTLTTNSFSSAGLGDTELCGASVALGLTW